MSFLMWDKKSCNVLSHVTHLGLLRPFLHNWFEHIIWKAGPALVVNLKPRE